MRRDKRADGIIMTKRNLKRHCKQELIKEGVKKCVDEKFVTSTLSRPNKKEVNSLAFIEALELLKAKAKSLR